MRRGSITIGLLLAALLLGTSVSAYLLASKQAEISEDQQSHAYYIRTLEKELDELGSGGGKVVRDPNAASLPITLSDSSQVTDVLPQATGGSNASTTFPAGSVLFDDGTRFVQNNTQLFWDNTNLRLGVATSAPGNELSVGGLLLVDNLVRSSVFIATSTAGSGIGTTSPGAVLAVAGGGLFKGTLYVESTTTVNSLIATSTGAEFRNGGVTTSCKLVSDGVVNPKEGNCFEIATTTDGAVEIDVSGLATNEHFTIKVGIFHNHTEGTSDIYFTNGGTASGTYYTSATDTPWAVSPGFGEVDWCSLWNSTSTLAIYGSC